MALNVALYGAGGRRWAMTERGRASARRGVSEFAIGPSRLHWDGNSLLVEIDEIGMPLPQRVRGSVRLWPQGLSCFSAALDREGRHRWGPIAPCSRIEVDLAQPGCRWSGHAYLDSNEGDEPIDGPFQAWDWSRATLKDGSTAVLYDVRPKQGAEHLIARRFAPDGSSTPFDAPPRQAVQGSTLWRVGRSMRSDAGAAPVRLQQTLEDTPFYARSVLDCSLLGERVTALHETLLVPRVVSWPVRLMLPWRMPRRG